MDLLYALTLTGGIGDCGCKRLPGRTAEVGLLTDTYLVCISGHLYRNQHLTRTICRGIRLDRDALNDQA